MARKHRRRRRSGTFKQQVPASSTSGSDSSQSQPSEPSQPSEDASS
jgi:hypothetical protein